MSNVVNMANAGHVRRGCARISERMGLCDSAAREVLNRAMHSLRCGATPENALKCAREMASGLARATEMLRPDGGAA